MSLALGLLVMPLVALAVDKPDLQVTSLTSPFLTTTPKHVFPGDTITITAIVTNMGPGDTQVPPQTDNATKFFLVPCTPNPSTSICKVSGQKKNLKGIQIIKTPLAMGESDGSPATLALYSDTVAGTYYPQACADGFGFVAESTESNNCTPSGDVPTAGSIIIVDAAPDLIISAIKTPSLPGGSVGVGGSFLVENTVRNMGAAAAAKSVTTYFLVTGPPSNITKDLKGPLDHPCVLPGGDPTTPVPCPTATAPCDPVIVGDTRAAEVQALTQLNGAFDHCEEFEIVTVRPDTDPGTYFLKACADGKKVLSETDNDNNCLTSSGSFKVVAMPDLVVTSLTVDPPLPLTVSPGDPLVITAVVMNQGGARAAKQSELKAILVNVVKDVNNLEVQKNVRLTSPLTVPVLDTDASATINSANTASIYSDTQPGKYFLRICADKNKDIPEAVESNNCIDSNDPDTSKTVTVLGPTSNADLQVSAITNPQCSKADGSTVACLNVVPGNNVSAKVTVVNSGTEAVAASSNNPLAISFKLIQGPNDNPTKEKSLKVLNPDSMSITQPLLPGQSKDLQPTVQVFSDTLPGNWAVQVCVDEAGKFAETNNNNNCTTVPPPVCSTTVIDPLTVPVPPTKNKDNPCPASPPGCIFGANGTCTGQFHVTFPGVVTVNGVSTAGANLIVSGIGNPPSTAALGDSFNLTFTAKNAGVATADASHTKFLLVTTDTPPVVVADLKGPDPTTNDIPLLLKGQSLTLPETLTIRTNSPLGVFKVQVCLDSGNPQTVTESNENDNCRTTSGTIEVRGLPDYVVTSIAVTNAAPQVKRGAKLDLTAKVMNQGIGPATKDSILGFYLVDSTCSPSSQSPCPRVATLIGTKTVGRLDAGESTAVLTVSVGVPNNAPIPAPGTTYRLQACADATNLLLESGTGPLGSSEQNNCATTTTTMVVIP